MDVTDDQCRPGCPICTDTTPPQDWDAPWPAYQWSPELEQEIN
jgi:hypothetical protein